MWNIVNAKRGTLNKIKNEYSTISAQNVNDYFTNMAVNIVNNIPSAQHSPLQYLSKTQTFPEFVFQEVGYTTVWDVFNQMKNNSSSDAYGVIVKLPNSNIKLQ